MSETIQNRWLPVLAGVLYIVYLAWVLWGGMKKKKIKPVLYIGLTVLMIYGLIQAYQPPASAVLIINMLLILVIGFFKGIVLGRKKIVEKANGTWTIRHDWQYIALWLLFFGAKLAGTGILRWITNVEMPMWHIVLYFSFYYPWRTFNVFRSNPQMRREVLAHH